MGIGLHYRIVFKLIYRLFRGPHSSYQRVVQGKCPLHFLNLNGVVCSNTLFSNTFALTSPLLFWGNSTCKILEHLVCSDRKFVRARGPQNWNPEVFDQKRCSRILHVEFALNNRELVKGLKAEVFEKRVFEQTTPLK